MNYHNLSNNVLPILAITVLIFEYVTLLTTNLILPLLLLTRFWWIFAIFGIWCYFDRSTFETGGRQIDWFKNFKLWEYSKRYFPVDLVLTDALDPRKNYLFSCHPHGIFPLGLGLNLCVRQTLHPRFKVHVATLPFFNYTPLLREFIMAYGCISCSAKSLSNVLSRPGGGHVVCLFPGGVREAANAYRGTNRFIIIGRKGFIRIALQTGSPIVPVITFGENDYGNLVECSSIFWLQKLCKRLTGFFFVVVYGRGFTENSVGPLPFRTRLTTVVGKPLNVEKTVNPTDELINEIHGRYIDELSGLFHKYKFLLKQPKDNILLLE